MCHFCSRELWISTQNGIIGHLSLAGICEAVSKFVPFHFWSCSPGTTGQQKIVYAAFSLNIESFDCVFGDEVVRPTTFNCYVPTLKRMRNLDPRCRVYSLTKFNTSSSRTAFQFESKSEFEIFSEVCWRVRKYWLFFVSSGQSSVHKYCRQVCVVPRPLVPQPWIRLCLFASFRFFWHFPSHDCSNKRSSAQGTCGCKVPRTQKKNIQAVGPYTGVVVGRAGCVRGYMGREVLPLGLFTTLTSWRVSAIVRTTFVYCVPLGRCMANTKHNAILSEESTGVAGPQLPISETLSLLSGQSPSPSQTENLTVSPVVALVIDLCLKI